MRRWRHGQRAEESADADFQGPAIAISFGVCLRETVEAALRARDQGCRHLGLRTVS